MLRKSRTDTKPIFQLVYPAKISNSPHSINTLVELFGNCVLMLVTLKVYKVKKSLELLGIHFWPGLDWEPQ